MSNVPITKERPKLNPSFPSTSKTLMIFRYLINKASSELQLQLSLKEMTATTKTVSMITGPLVKQAWIGMFFLVYLNVSMFSMLFRALIDAAGKEEATSDIVGEDYDETAIMSPECQDPLLAKTYLGLPNLP